MKIALLAIIDFENWKPIGGISSYIRQILPSFEKIKDIDELILLGVTYDKKNLYKRKKIGRKSVFFPVFFVNRNSYLPSRIQVFYQSFYLIKSLRKYIKDLDLVYSHSEEAAFGLIWKQKDRQRYILVHHLHGKGNAVLYAKRKFLRNKIFIWGWELIRKCVVKNSDMVISINDDTSELAIKYGKSEEDILEINNTVNFNIFRPINLEKEDKNTILFVGRIAEVKGLELFVDTIIELNKDDKEKRWTGVIVGEGEYRERLERYIVQKRAGEFIKFLGTLNPEELVYWYNKALVTLITSYHEGIPMALLESLACGTPVVSTEVGGIREILNKGNGYTIKVRDPKAFKAVILKLSEKEKDDIKELCRKSIVHLSADKVAEKMINSFSQLISIKNKDIFDEREKK